MHMSDALVSPAVAGVMFAAAGTAAAVSIKKIKSDPLLEKKIPVMGVMGAFVFAAQMINFTVPGTGSSGHIAGAVLLTSLLGPWAAFISMTAVLMIQAFFFADGGLLALGCNIFNMAFFGCFAGGFLVWRPLMKNGISRPRITAGSVAACILTLQAGAACVVLETACSGISDISTGMFFSLMQPVHLAIGAVEGMITAAVLSFVYSARPEILWCGEGDSGRKNSMSMKKFLLIAGLAVVLTAGCLSFFASSLPDGLEWSLEKITGSSEPESSGRVYDLFGRVQEQTAVLPDYGEGVTAGLPAAGIAGAAAVCLVCIFAGGIIQHRRKRQRFMSDPCPSEKED